MGLVPGEGRKVAVCWVGTVLLVALYVLPRTIYFLPLDVFLLLHPYYLLLPAIGLGSTAAFLTIFYRDPERVIGEGIVSPADGVIKRISYERPWLSITIFMNIHNVHVVRAPYHGLVLRTVRHGRRHYPAYRPESGFNERIVVHLKTRCGPMKVNMVSGKLARTVIPYVHKGYRVKKGERIGYIKLGSRVDLILPIHFEPNVVVGSKVLAGVTTIAVETKVGSRRPRSGVWVVVRRG